MSEFLNTPNSELDEQQIRLKEEFQISQGPLSVLQNSVRNHTQILIALRNNKKLLARVKAFDNHSNMVLENVKEVGVAWGVWVGWEGEGRAVLPYGGHILMRSVHTRPCYSLPICRCGQRL